MKHEGMLEIESEFFLYPIIFRICLRYSLDIESEAITSSGKILPLINKYS